MSGPLAANPDPRGFDAGPLGPLYVGGAVSGLAIWQNNTFAGDDNFLARLSNGQFFVQKPDGLFQYFLQLGAYSIPELGAPYLAVPTAVHDFFGPLPTAYAKVAFTDAVSIEAGKLPGLIGLEDNFTFQNMNIERGLLWSQQPTIGRGTQLNYTAGPLALGFAVNQGFYTSRYSFLSGAATYTLDRAGSFVAIAGSNHPRAAGPASSTRSLQDDETLLDVEGALNSAPWNLTAYFQYTNVPANPSLGAFAAASTYGGALLASYTFGRRSPLSGFSLPVRAEYIASTGSATNGAPNLLYGPGSAAWSVTVTPTYQYKMLFARAELSQVGTRGFTAGLAFGPGGRKPTQTRVLFETGILF